MRLTNLLAAAGLCLAGLLGPLGSALADPARDASAECVGCHDSDDLPDMSRGPHASPNAGPDADTKAGATDRPPPMAAAAEAMRRRSMGDAADARTPTCIACHGASTAHVKKPDGATERPRPDVTYGRKSQVGAERRSEVCLSCHAKDAKQALWLGSQHPSADVACNSCHQVHTNNDRVLAKTSQTEVCLACHKTQRSQLNRPSHHPVVEGKIACSDCHNTHGSAGPKLVRRDSINATCYTCHAEKRGPFVHAHEPVSEDCSTCHNAHGSTIPAMLKVRPPMLCQQCHTAHVAGGIGAVGGQPGVFPPALTGQFPPAVTANSNGKNVVNLWQGRSCMNCHTQVHGSNNPSATNPTPQLLLR